MDERNAADDSKWLSIDDDLLESCGRSGAVHRVALYWITRAVEAEASRDKLRAACAAYIQWAESYTETCSPPMSVTRAMKAAITPTAKEPR